MGIPRMWSHAAGTTGNDSGTTDMAQAHAAATDYYISPPAGEVWDVNRMIWSIRDAKGMETTTYGSQTALGVGMKIIVSRNGTETDLTATHGIQDNADMSHYCYDVSLLAWTNTAEETAVGRWTFGKSGAPIRLTADDKLIVRFGAGDNLSGATEHRVIFQGVSYAYSD